MLINLFIEFLVLTFLLWNVRADEYTNHLQKYCKKTRKPFFCVKYRILKIIDDFEYESPDSETVRLVKIEPKVDNTYDLTAPRYLETDTELEKVIKFFQRKLVRFANTHGFQFRLPEGVEIISSRGVNNSNIVRQEISTAARTIESQSDQRRGNRGKIKEKKIFILSVLIMAKLIKIKFIMAMVFSVLLIIKKVILIAAVTFPSVLSHLKQVCQQHHQKALIAGETKPSHSWFEWKQDNVDGNSWK
ncbi:uncharacterized protein LOC143200209 [Rhynchophorus ferrugineus]|uniref:uncharacterized protein LOC143200209 n=1 Tax=Rhynchophorus ferrugineus TaxID=354439 RepID=UPI003FCD083C